MKERDGETEIGHEKEQIISKWGKMLTIVSLGKGYVGSLRIIILIHVRIFPKEKLVCLFFSFLPFFFSFFNVQT